MFLDLIVLFKRETSLFFTECSDNSEYCAYWKKNWGCSHGGVAANCKETCNICGSGMSLISDYDGENDKYTTSLQIMTAIFVIHYRLS